MDALALHQATPPFSCGSRSLVISKPTLFFAGFAAFDDTVVPAAAKHKHTVAQVDEHVEIFTDIKDGDPLLLLFIEQMINRVARVDIQTANGVSGHQHGTGWLQSRGRRALSARCRRKGGKREWRQTA